MAQSWINQRDKGERRLDEIDNGVNLMEDEKYDSTVYPFGQIELIEWDWLNGIRIESIGRVNGYVACNQMEPSDGRMMGSTAALGRIDDEPR